MDPVILRLSRLLKTMPCDEEARLELIELVIDYGRAMQQQGWNQAANQIAITFEQATAKQVGA